MPIPRTSTNVEGVEYADDDGEPTVDNGGEVTLSVREGDDWKKVTKKADEFGMSPDEARRLAAECESSGEFAKRAYGGDYYADSADA